jgi:hypothetical protein
MEMLTVHDGDQSRSTRSVHLEIVRESYADQLVPSSDAAADVHREPTY